MRDHTSANNTRNRRAWARAGTIRICRFTHASFYFASWYDARTGKRRYVQLGTTDLQEAKTITAKLLIFPITGNRSSA
jgi:hypothetical protein